MLALSALPAGAAPIAIDAPDELRTFLLKNIDRNDAGESGDAAARAAQLQEARQRVPELLATEGYFTPRVDVRDDGNEARLIVTPGPRAHVAAVELEFRGDVPAERRQTLREQWSLAPGQPFRQPAWDEAKQALLRQLLAVDYAGARLAESRAEVDPQAASVRLRVVYDAGPRYVFGPLRIEGLQRYPPALVERYNRSVRPGQPYREDQLLALQASLQATPYFASALVEAEPAVATAATEAAGPAEVPVVLRLSERQPHRVGLGTGFSSNTGARVEANYHTADLFHRAWELQGGVRLEQLRQTAYADIFLPPDEADRRDSFGTSFDHSLIQGLDLRRAAVGAVRSQLRGSIESRLTLNLQQERQKTASLPATTNQALTLSNAWTWRRIDSRIDPRDGTVLMLELGGAAKVLASDQNFLRTHGRVQQFFPLGRRDVLTLRGELGITAAPSRDGIPQDFLFRAGGSQSVRGYAYQSLGVKRDNATLGGRYLAIGSVEVTHWLNAQWGVALFVDSGNAGDELKRFPFATGYGIGARWKSPAGPLALDVAYGQRSHGVQFHFSLAIPF